MKSTLFTSDFFLSLIFLSRKNKYLIILITNEVKKMENRSVYGSYLKLEKANEATDDLLKQGVDVEDIYFVGRKDVVEEIESPFNAIVYEPERAETSDSGFSSMMENLSEIFTGEDVNDDPFQDYHHDLERGYILLVVNRELDEEGRIKKGALGPQDIGEYHKSIKLHQERLKVSKNIVEDSHVRVEKKVIEEMKKIEVPLRREELHVTRIKVDGDGNEIPGTEVVHVVPLSYENPIIESETILVGEIDVDKVIHRSEETVSEKVLKEEMIIDEKTEGQSDIYRNEKEDTLPKNDLSDDLKH